MRTSSRLGNGCGLHHANYVASLTEKNNDRRENIAHETAPYLLHARIRLSISYIITALKGAIRFFFNNLTAPRSVSHTFHSSGPGAIVCKSRAAHTALRGRISYQCLTPSQPVRLSQGDTWYEGTAQLLRCNEKKKPNPKPKNKSKGMEP